MTDKEVIIIGAGAAGLMCAIEAGKRGRSVVVLEHNPSVGRKIRISGGGRCNFTNTRTTAHNFLSSNAHFAKSALARFTPTDLCKMVDQHAIAHHEKKLGQLFCDHSAQNIIDLLIKECRQYQVSIRIGTKIMHVDNNKRFDISTSEGSFSSESLVIATGGLSIPSLGATNLGYKIAQQFNIKVTPCRPGLVPLVLQSQDLNIFKDLAGVSVDAKVSFENMDFRENILFTHLGLSGPAILQISSYWQPGKPIRINLIPDVVFYDLLKSRHQEQTHLKTVLKSYLPSRLAEILCQHFLKDKPLNRFSLEELKRTGDLLNRFEITPKDTEGYAKAEVTVGGVDTDELSSKTMETKKVPGLYFIGEVVDVTGQLGGFNFQWAWASGYAAGQYV